MITVADLEKANSTIKTTDIKGKEYAEVPQRIRAFRMCYPEGTISTELLSDDGGVCVFRASVYDGDILLGTGTAFERADSSFINKTSYIENCETSAVGRALGMAGFGIMASVASAEEVQNAMLNQGAKEAPAAGAKASPRQVEILAKVYTGDNLTRLLTANRIQSLNDMPMEKASQLIEAISKRSS